MMRKRTAKHNKRRSTAHMHPLPNLDSSVPIALVADIASGAFNHHEISAKHGIYSSYVMLQSLYPNRDIPFCDLSKEACKAASLVKRQLDEQVILHSIETGRLVQGELSLISEDAYNDLCDKFADDCKCITLQSVELRSDRRENVFIPVSRTVFEPA